MRNSQKLKTDAGIYLRLSRDEDVGRDYITNGNYIENIFPRMGVRFICVNESYDSQLDPEMEDFLLCLNIANQLHAKQSGKKSQQARMAMARRGEYIGGRAPYGYVLDPEDKHHLIVEPESAEVVKNIFLYACDGLGYKAIARRLDEAGVENPTAHTGDNAVGRRDSDWNPSTVKDILTKEVYLGKTVSGKRRKLLLKSPEITRMPEKDWLVVEGTHEAIIDQQTWDTA